MTHLSKEKTLFKEKHISQPLHSDRRAIINNKHKNTLLSIGLKLMQPNNKTGLSTQGHLLKVKVIYSRSYTQGVQTYCAV